MTERLVNIGGHFAPTSKNRDALLQKSPDDIVITYLARTPLCKGHKGGFKDTTLDSIVTKFLTQIAQGIKISPELVEDICLGNVSESNAGYFIRAGAMAAGFPPTTTTHTLNRFCSSGLVAIQQIAGHISTGVIEIGIAMGAESMTVGGDLLKQPFSVDILGSNNANAVDCMQPMGQTSENVASDFGILREHQDRFAAESQNRALHAQKEGWFQDEIVPITTVRDGQTITLMEDECIRPSTYETLSRLKPVFTKWGDRSTAGNSSQVSDGAAAVLMMKRSKAEELGLPVLAKFCTMALAGLAPRIMGIGPTLAIPKLLQRVGISMDDVDVVEINEAFASMAVYCRDQLNIPWAKLNPRGGSIALGHPLACTGVRQVVTGLSECRRTGKKILLTSQMSRYMSSLYSRVALIFTGSGSNSSLNVLPSDCPAWTPEHLQRHILSHGNIRSFACQFCDTSFVRRDALLRHLRTCKDRISVSAEVPKLTKRKRGRKQSSCDTCSEMKRRCSRTMPCDNCVALNLVCSLIPGTTEETTDRNSNSPSQDLAIALPEDSISPIDMGVWQEDQNFEDLVLALDTDGTIAQEDSATTTIGAEHNDTTADDSYTEAISAISADSLSGMQILYNLFAIPTSLTQPQSVPMPHRFFFLERITAATGVARSFDCGNPNERRQIMFALSGTHPFVTAYRNATPQLLLEDNYVEPAEMESTSTVTSQTPPLLNQAAESTSPKPSFTSLDMEEDSMQQQHPLSLKSQEIVAGISSPSNTTTTQEKNLLETSAPAHELRCQLFFSPQSLERHLIAFWSLWYPNWPVFHRPSFRASQKPATLVAVMALMGAVLESDSVVYHEALY
ncbi:hypothetical protein VHEMI04033 [[Torrubiella] hemipterigena]|uniref:Uncharacterized protein n=1 Tax=[Torrubiella] hemipterigena TaxID=1531966 RepID=A0A0A1T064_9HYPO|nr:hypothetical protein VHEMI04033 [[Torrubiella] hemipterigena]